MCTNEIEALIMHVCPDCSQARGVMPLVEAMRRDATLRPSEFDWIMESQWGSRPVLRAPLGTQRISDRVLRQLKRPAGGVPGALQSVAGVILGVALAIFGIPLFIVALFWLAAMSFVLLPIFLVGWLIGVVLLAMWGLRQRSTSDPYRRALVRLADLSYCSACDTIFETETGRIVPLDRLHELLYAEKRGMPTVNYLARRQ